MLKRSKKKKPINTTDQARKDFSMRTWVLGGNPGAIEMQEAEGQQSFVNSDTLPTDMSHEDREALKAMGVVFGKIVEGDDLFQYVKLPKGWKKSSTDHSMHNDLLDEKGRKRAGIFYKAAFYDRRASLHCIRRFHVNIDYDKLEKGVAEAVVDDLGVKIYRTTSITFDTLGGYQIEDVARKNAIKEAEVWLVERFPDWESAAAYWD